MLARIAAWSIASRKVVLVLLAGLLMSGVALLKSLPIDAVPDVSTIQVAVLTDAPGLSPEEVERMVTFPVEAALNGTPGLTELRSVSRSGLSAVTIVFRDDVDVWFARQLVVERLRDVEGDLPPSVGRPQLAPVSTGLGEIYQFVVRSDTHSPMQLRTILDWEIVPKLRSVPGVIEVNTMGGQLKQYQVIIDPHQLMAHGLSIAEVSHALERANQSVGGGYLEPRSESLTLRGVGLLHNENDIASVLIKSDRDGTPVLVKHVGSVRIGAALRNGIITQDGKGEAVSGIVMMLLGANSRNVIHDVHAKVDTIRAALPPGVAIEVVYDRADFVGRTLATVLKNLLEGLLVVTIVLALFLGTIRGALAVVIGIPASMCVALFGMHAFSVTGDLMSLGAIDFGFLVDGPIVMLEAIIAGTAGKALVGDAKHKAYGEACARVLKPVGFSVAIIMLVYLPLLTLEGIEGKMFRPMAITMACALAGALIYSVFFFPALLVTFVPTSKSHGPRWLDAVERTYAKLLPMALQKRKLWLGSSAALLVFAIVLLSRAGADFVPRIDEGDAVVTIRRAPSIGLEKAGELDLQVERVLKDFPEVLTSLGMTGRAELAFDPVGNDNTDMLVHLKPKEEWTSASDLDGLSDVFKRAIEGHVPGTFVSVSQPIEDRTNEMISGSRADVQVQLFGPELGTLRDLSEQVATLVKSISGTGDVRVERVLGLPMLTVEPDRSKLARHGVLLEDALGTLEAARMGRKVGVIFEGQKRFDLRLLVPPTAATPEALGDLFVPTATRHLVPLAELAKIEETEGPAQVRRENFARTVRVEVNLRGRDLVSWVQEAQQKAASTIQLPTGYSLTWGGQFENFERAQKRLGLVVPLALAIIFVMLLAMFQNVRYAGAVFCVVPLALIGGIFGLVARGMSFSISAAVGFIALAGVSVLTGVVMADDVRRRIDEGDEVDQAITHGAMHTLRAILTTAAVAAMGFLPMMLATGAGSEVQRPLATVVVFGIFGATLLTLFVLPGILKWLVRATP